MPPPKANAWPVRERAAMTVTAEIALILFMSVFLLEVVSSCKEVFHEPCQNLNIS
jgi:hypothetical protein